MSSNWILKRDKLLKTLQNCNLMHAYLCLPTNSIQGKLISSLISLHDPVFLSRQFYTSSFHFWICYDTGFFHEVRPLLILSPLFILINHLELKVSYKIHLNNCWFCRSLWPFQEVNIISLFISPCTSEPNTNCISWMWSWGLLVLDPLIWQLVLVLLLRFQEFQGNK